MAQIRAQDDANAEITVPTVGDHAYWDSRQGVFRVSVHGSDEFGMMAILPDAPLFMTHLDTSEHNKKTKLGDELQARLQIELATALDRHAHQVGTGITLLTHEQMRQL
jgi:hypothetical protein